MRSIKLLSSIEVGSLLHCHQYSSTTSRRPTYQHPDLDNIRLSQEKQQCVFCWEDFFYLEQSSPNSDQFTPMSLTDMRMSRDRGQYLSLKTGQPNDDLLVFSNCPSGHGVCCGCLRRYVTPDNHNVSLWAHDSGKIKCPGGCQSLTDGFSVRDMSILLDYTQYCNLLKVVWQTGGQLSMKSSSSSSSQESIMVKKGFARCDFRLGVDPSKGRHPLRYLVKDVGQERKEQRIKEIITLNDNLLTAQCPECFLHLEKVDACNSLRHCKQTSRCWICGECFLSKEVDPEHWIRVSSSLSVGPNLWFPDAQRLWRLAAETPCPRWDPAHWNHEDPLCQMFFNHPNEIEETHQTNEMNEQDNICQFNICFTETRQCTVAQHAQTRKIFNLFRKIKHIQRLLSSS
jgi:hypothetical protein